MSNNLLTMNEICETLHISKSTLSRLCNEGLPHIKVTTKNYLFDENEVMKYLKAKSNNASTQLNNFKYDYRNVLIVPLTDPNSINWYNGTNNIEYGVRRYVTNEDAAKHVHHIQYVAPIINKQISYIDVIVKVEYVDQLNLGYSSPWQASTPCFILIDGLKLTKPINTSNQNGPGFTLNCLDIMLNNQGADLKVLTDIRNKRMMQYPI